MQNTSPSTKVHDILFLICINFKKDRNGSEGVKMTEGTQLDEEEAQNSKRDFTFTNLNLTHQN